MGKLDIEAIRHMIEGAAEMGIDPVASAGCEFCKILTASGVQFAKAADGFVIIPMWIAKAVYEFGLSGGYAGMPLEEFIVKLIGDR